MNSKLNFIFSRRSIRKFKNQQLPGETVCDLLEAAMAAPSACAKDPWHFIVVTEQNTLKKIAMALPYGKFLSDAAVGIIICGDLGKAHGNELSYLLQDSAAAIENLLLAATALGLGACWLGIHPREDRIAYLQNLFKLPENVLPISAVAAGYPLEDVPLPRTRYNPAQIHYEKWD